MTTRARGSGAAAVGALREFGEALASGPFRLALALSVLLHAGLFLALRGTTADPPRRPPMRVHFVRETAALPGAPTAATGPAPSGKPAEAGPAAPRGGPATAAPAREIPAPAEAAPPASAPSLPHAASQGEEAAPARFEAPAKPAEAPAPLPELKPDAPPAPPPVEKPDAAMDVPGGQRATGAATGESAVVEPSPGRAFPGTQNPPRMAWRLREDRAPFRARPRRRRQPVRRRRTSPGCAAASTPARSTR